MAKFDDATIQKFREMCEQWLKGNTKGNFTCADIKTGTDAWAVASRANVTAWAYEDATVTDGHIQTALEKIFPNAVFRDKKVY